MKKKQLKKKENLLVLIKTNTEFPKTSDLPKVDLPEIKEEEEEAPPVAPLISENKQQENTNEIEDDFGDISEKLPEAEFLPLTKDPPKIEILDPIFNLQNETTDLTQEKPKKPITVDDLFNN